MTLKHSSAICAAVILSFFILTNITMSEEKIHASAVAGSFYPDDPAQLKAIIKTCLDRVNVPEEGKNDILGIIVPHAGYVYSAQTAAAAYKCIQGKKYDAAIILSPSHHAYFRGASVYSGTKYVTPLGDVVIDQELANALTKFGGRRIVRSEVGHSITDDTMPEHAIEVQLPFLQTVQPGLPIVPVIIGSEDAETVISLSKAIVNTIKSSGKHILVIASSDLSHYRGCYGSTQ